MSASRLPNEHADTGAYPPEVSPAPGTSSRILSLLPRLLDQSGLLAVLLLAVVVMSFASPVFLTASNFNNIMYVSTIAAIVALGQTVVMIAGGIDLSVGSVVALSSVLSVGVVVNSGLPPVVGIVVAVAAGAAVGVINGIAVTKFRITPLITTLATLTLVRGVAYVYSGGQNLAPVPDLFNVFGTATFEGIPVVVLFGVVIVVLTHIALSYTRFGRYVYATGGNSHTARIAGIPTDGVVLGAFVVSGMAAGIGGIIVSAQLGAGAATYGSGLELTTIAAAVIGGTSLFGGRGTVMGTIVGVLLLALVQNAINILQVPANWDQIVSGSVILFAAGLDTYRRRRLGQA